MNWWKLRSVGNLWVLKVSYAALIAVPFLAAHNAVPRLLGFEVWFLAAIYFASLFLGLANLLYDIGCPPIVKRFPSPNDLYEKMLEIRARCAALYPNDGFDASLEHCKTAYKDASVSNPTMRYLCTFFYFGAAFFFAIIFLNRSWIVLKAWLRTICCDESLP